MWIKMFRAPLRELMAKKCKEIKAGKLQQWKRVKLSAEAALQCMQAFGKRREQFIAAI
jgi:hypothetical protein